MKDDLLETVIQSAYDSGYKTGYANAVKDGKCNPITESSIEFYSKQKLWLTPEELEKEFSIRRSTQAKMRMSGRIPYHKIGKYVRYKRTDINKWLDLAKMV